MKILKISDVYFPRINGVSTSIITFRRELMAMGHEVELICPSYRGQEADDDPGLHRVASNTVPFDPEDRLMRYDRIMALTETLREKRFDIVHIHTPFIAHYAGMRLAQRLGIPVVETYHTFFEEYLHNYLPLLPRAMTSAIARYYSRRQCNVVDAIITPSKPMMEVLRGYGVETMDGVIPTGIDADRFREGDGPAFRQRHSIAPERPLITFVGRLAHEKNIDFLLHMLARLRERLPEVLLVIVGEGPARHHLDRLSHQLKLDDNLLFVGYLDRETELIDCYSAADCFVFASRTETQGMVIVEALAMGLPVVSTAVMGTRDILINERGAIIAEEEVDDFAAVVKLVLSDPELRRRLSEEGRIYMREWSSRRMADRLSDFYREVIALSQQRSHGSPSLASGTP